jgi:hypothetical protein
MRPSSPVGRLFASGRIVDCIIGLMLLELIVLGMVRARTQRGIHPNELAVSVAAGIALLLALRAALVGQSWRYIAAWLVSALIAHLLYLKLSWRSQ